ncbi:MAG TPA: hypothetical protein DGD08_05190 [Gemmatimonas aurantiaca]|uniref:Uncharacterized protein n=1 Tax=Gemmatimonas aurantiaca TaxID=173480 RepID=A0A3D4V622_9BACT|nr:hypothetical protein [Gemmatimonas aurantiaca]HCT56593.1 hypothetical protein [Gemmatimonas aurantiaca]
MVTRATASAALLMAMCAAVTGVSVAGAQGTGQTVGATKGHSREAVRLMVRPRVGDTLWMQIEQSVELRPRRGTNPRSSGTTPDYGPRADRPPGQVTRLSLFAHSLVEASDLSETVLLATSDSMTLAFGAGGEFGAPRRQTISDDARQVRVRVRPDGSMRIHDPPPTAVSLGATLASVPGLLPEAPISVGSEWTREMTLPTLPVGGFRAAGVVQVRLRLDSLARNGRDAWVSLSGVLRRSGAASDWPPGASVVTAGTISGFMQVDRQRAWIVKAYTELEVSSDLAPGTGVTGPARTLDMRIVQQVRVW